MNICKNTYLSNQNVLFIQSLYLCFNYVVTIASYQSILFSGKYTDGPTNPSNCTDIHPKLLMNIIFASKMVN